MKGWSRHGHWTTACGPSPPLRRCHSMCLPMILPRDLPRNSLCGSVVSVGWDFLAFIVPAFLDLNGPAAAQDLHARDVSIRYNQAGAGVPLNTAWYGPAISSDSHPH